MDAHEIVVHEVITTEWPWFSAFFEKHSSTARISFLSGLRALLRRHSLGTGLAALQAALTSGVDARRIFTVLDSILDLAGCDIDDQLAERDRVARAFEALGCHTVNMARSRVSKIRRQSAAATCYNQTDPLPLGRKRVHRIPGADDSEPLNLPVSWVEAAPRRMRQAQSDSPECRRSAEWFRSISPSQREPRTRLTARCSLINSVRRRHPNFVTAIGAICD